MIQLSHFILGVVHYSELAFVVVNFIQTELFVGQAGPEHVVSTGNQVGLRATHKYNVTKIKFLAVVKTGRGQVALDNLGDRVVALTDHF